MISTRDLAWTAGFLEGEGTFGYYNCARVSACQVQREPLDRLVALFGGRLKQELTNRNPIWRWALRSRRSIQLMMTLYCLMSPKRKGEIERVLAKWKSARAAKEFGSIYCRNGHDLSRPDAAYRYNVGNTIQVVCKICAADRQRRRNAARRKAPQPGQVN